MSAHAVYAPSSAHRWMPCTASAEAIARLGEQEEGEEAAKGTAAHEEIERCLGPLNETEAAGGDFTALSLPVNVEHPAAYGVALVLDYVRKLVTATPGRLWIEQRVMLTPDIWGRCDVAHWHAESATLTIVDYKNGFVDVDAVENEQLQIYAAGSIFSHNLPAKWIRLVVVQPNSLMPVPRVKQHVMSADELYAFATRAAAVPGGPKTFTAGAQCKYCPMFGRCPASQDVLAKLSVALVNEPAEVSPAQRALFMACKKPVEDWFEKAGKVWTKDAIASGTPPAGMKLVTGVTKRAWKDEKAARAFVLAERGVDALDPPTPAQAEKLGLDVSKLAEQPPGGPVLAFESDKRKPWSQKTAVEMFANVLGAK